MPSSKNLQSGFTLVELLVAIVIMAVGFLGLAQLQITAIKANSQSTTSIAATALTQQALEKIMAWDSDDARLDVSGTGTFPSVNVQGAGTYTINWAIVTSYEGVTNLCRIDVVVQSTQAVMGVLGHNTRTVTAHIFKRSI